MSARFLAVLAVAVGLTACGPAEEEEQAQVAPAEEITVQIDDMAVTDDQAATSVLSSETQGDDGDVVQAFLDQLDTGNRTNVEQITSPGGIEAWLVQESAVPLIAVEIGFKGGSRLDPTGKEGLAYMVSGLLDEGAGDLDSEAFQGQLEELAVRLSFNAGRDGFFGSVRTLSENKEEAFRLLRLALTEPRFDAEPIERVRGQILVQLNRDASSPRAMAQLKWFETVFGEHPYGRPTKGTPETVASLNADDMRAYVDRIVTKSNLKISVVGDIDVDTLGRLLDETFGDLPDGPAEVDIPSAEISAGGDLIVIERDQPQSVAIFGGEGLLLDDPDFFPAFVMNYVLGGGGFASRLMEEVREKRGLAYGVSTGFSPFDAGGVFVGQVATENERVSESLDIIRQEIGRMRDGGVTDEELANAKTYLTGSFPLRFDSNSKIANQLVSYQLTGRGIDYINTRNSKIEAVTGEDIARVAQRLLDPDALTVVVVGKPQGLEATQ